MASLLYASSLLIRARASPRTQKGRIVRGYFFFAGESATWTRNRAPPRGGGCVRAELMTNFGLQEEEHISERSSIVYPFICLFDNREQCRGETRKGYPEDIQRNEGETGRRCARSGALIKRKYCVFIMFACLPSLNKYRPPEKRLRPAAKLVSISLEQGNTAAHQAHHACPYSYFRGMFTRGMQTSRLPRV